MNVRVEGHLNPSNDKLQKERTVYFTKKDSGKKHGPQARERPTKYSHTEENVVSVDELVSLLSQEDQKQTLRSTRQISTETGLTQCIASYRSFTVISV